MQKTNNFVDNKTAENFYKEKIGFFNKAFEELNETKEKLLHINKKQPETAEKEEYLSVSGKNLKNRRKAGEKITKIGEELLNMTKAATPQGFAKVMFKEITDLMKEIAVKMEEFDKKFNSFSNYLYEKYAKKPMKEAEESLNTEEIKEKGVLGIKNETLKNISMLEEFQNILEKTGLIDKEQINLLKEGKYQELIEKSLESSNLMPGNILINTLIGFNKIKDSIVESLSEHIEEKSRQYGIPGHQIMANEMSDIDTEKARKVAKVVGDVAEKILHPTAQAVAKGAKIAEKGLGALEKTKNIKNREREV